MNGLLLQYLGASKPKQVTDAVEAIKNYHFSTEELSKIEFILKQ